jgi:hypothetical protein
MAQMIAETQRGSVKVQLVLHRGHDYHPNEYTIQICQDGDWHRHGGRLNYYRNAQEARREYYNVSAILTDVKEVCNG